MLQETEQCQHSINSCLFSTSERMPTLVVLVHQLTPKAASPLLRSHAYRLAVGTPSSWRRRGGSSGVKIDCLGPAYARTCLLHSSAGCSRRSTADAILTASTPTAPPLSKTRTRHLACLCVYCYCHSRRARWLAAWPMHITCTAWAAIAILTSWIRYRTHWTRMRSAIGTEGLNKCLPHTSTYISQIAAARVRLSCPCPCPRKKPALAAWPRTMQHQTQRNDSKTTSCGLAFVCLED